MSEPLPLELPAGLSGLAAAERLRVERRGAGRYAVLGPRGPLLEARERPWGLAGLAGLLAGRNRDLCIEVFDLAGEKFMEMSRPFSLGGDVARVTLGGCGGWAGELRRELTFFRPVLSLHEQGRLVARLKGPIDTSGDCDFKVYGEAKQQTGVICLRRGDGGAAVAARRFELRLPRDAPVPHKAALLAACFLIDFLYFEH